MNNASVKITKEIKKTMKNKANIIYEIVKEEIDKFDVFGLLEQGCPEDEFEQEARLISNRVKDDMSEKDLAVVMAEVYAEQFCEEFNPDDFLPYAENIINKLNKK